MVFVKSWDTDVPVGRTKAAFEDLLRRYGATGFTVSEDYASSGVVVSFSIAQAEILFTINYRKVLERLRLMPEFRSKRDRKSLSTREQWMLDQAARVAWRHLYLWSDAALSAVDAGLQTVEDVFLSQHVLTGNAGERITAGELVRKLAPGGRLLLKGGSE